MSFLVASASAGSSFDFSAMTQIADTIVTLVGKVVTMITGSPLLLLGIGIGLFGGAIGIVRRFL